MGAAPLNRSGPGWTTPAGLAELYAAYTSWAEAMGHKYPLSKDSFNERLQKLDRRRDRARFGAMNLSPDGRYIGATSTDPSTKTNTVVLVPITGGEPLEVMKGGSTSETWGVLTWASDGRSILVRKTYSDPKQAQEVWQVPSDVGQPRKLYDLDSRVGPGQISVHLDDKRLAFAPAQGSMGQRRPAEVWVLESFLPGTTSAALSQKE